MWVFSDDNSRAKDQINWFVSRFNQFKFELFVGNAFESLKAMAEVSIIFFMCQRLVSGPHSWILDNRTKKLSILNHSWVHILTE